VWVNGRAFERPARPVWAGGHARAISGRLHRDEDPVDVHRVLLPARSPARVIVTPRWGDPEVAAYDARAVSIADSPQRIAGSHHRRGRETLLVENRRRRPRSVFIAISLRPSTPNGAGYTLRVG
jgi:hypothetical protein